ncbi:S1 family peptidase [Singulisphaera sp. PoT]|uniref:S1 family peptidase n=1 Tax=Singulisphaera sp. PoT TaxID=3411797 RepID=UPI003BF5B8D7
MEIMQGANRPILTGLLIALLSLASMPAIEAKDTDRPQARDAGTFRPTVLIRKGSAQGSGTVIASVPGETLVLTAAHVIEGQGALSIELHRYNLGLERSPAKGIWPRRVPAEVVARDRAADVAVLRVRKMIALPYVAKLRLENEEPTKGSVVTSVGIDLGTKLSSWSTRVAKVERFEIEGGGDDRLFLVTGKAPEHGRSGGGLFLENGELVGVCIGRSEALIKGKLVGIFASGASIRRLLHDHSLDETVVQAAKETRRAPVTTTHAGSHR